jgi:hypothetical protein
MTFCVVCGATSVCYFCPTFRQLDILTLCHSVRALIDGDFPSDFLVTGCVSFCVWLDCLTFGLLARPGAVVRSVLLFEGQQALGHS